MAEPTQAAAPAPAQYTAEMLPPAFVFEADGRCLVEHHLVPWPRALHGRVTDDFIHGAVAEGVDVYAVRPEALLFPSCNHRVGAVEVWGYFFAKRPAATLAARTGGSEGEDEVREVAAGGCWVRYGGEKSYVGEDGEACAFRSRFAFYEPAADDGGEQLLTPWRMKEVRLHEAAPAFRGVEFHPSAKDLVVLKVYYKTEIPEEETPMEYYSSEDDVDDHGGRRARSRWETRSPHPPRALRDRVDAFGCGADADAAPSHFGHAFWFLCSQFVSKQIIGNEEQ